MNWLKKNKLVTKFMPGLNSAKLSIHNQITLFTSVHDFLGNGFSLNEALKFCLLIHSEMTEPVKKIQRGLSRGSNFSDSIKDLVDFRIYCQIKIAEFHGNLLRTLSGIGRFLKMRRDQKNKLRGLMIYPIFLLIMLFGIMLAIHWLVTPQIQGLNASNSHGYGKWIIWILIPLILIIYVLWRYYCEQSRVQQINTLIKVPLLGTVYRSYYAYYLSSNLALMMNCGMDLQQILSFMKQFKSNQLIQSLSHDVKTLVDHGEKFDDLRIKYHFLPKELIMLINAGDTTRVLAQKLDSYSKLEFKLMMKKSSRVISMLQPAMFLIIGLIIAGTYLSMLLPMYKSIKGVY